MTAALNSAALDQLFNSARTAHHFKPEPLPEGTIEKLYELMKWGPTAFNAQPTRFVFITSDAGRARLKPALGPGNVPQVQAAPLTIIIAHDLQFFEHLPKLFSAYDAKPLYENNPALAQQVAFRNSSLQGGYLILAARALGLGVGPMSGFNAELVNQEFFPEGRYKVNFLLNVGIEDGTKAFPRGPRLSFDEVVSVI